VRPFGARRGFAAPPNLNVILLMAMGETNENHRKALPNWVIVVALVTSILGLAVLAILEIGGFQDSTWTTFAIGAFIYFPIQILVEGFLSGFWEKRNWVVKLIPVVILVGFYLAVLIIK
jgi:hypothetical protein